jgi:hypothetical protein
LVLFYNFISHENEFSEQSGKYGKLIGSYTGFGVLTAVDMNSFVFWDITPCILLKANQSFGGKCDLRLQGRKLSPTRNQREAGSKQNRLAACCLLHAGFLLGLFIDHEDGGYMFLRNVGLLSAGYTVVYPKR